MYNNSSIIEAATKKGRTNLLMQHILGNTKQWFIHYQADLYIPGYAGFGQRLMALTPLITECVCRNSDNFNRHQNQRRQKIEEKIANDLRERDISKTRLSYMSLGASGLLQELINIYLFLSQGFLNINATLVDPKFKRTASERGIAGESTELPEEKEKIFVEFMTKMAEERGAIINFRFLERIQDVPEAEKFDIIAAVDFDDFSKEYSDVCQTYTHLAPGGRFYIHAGMHDLIYDDKRCILSTLREEETPTLMIEKNEEKSLQNSPAKPDSSPIASTICDLTPQVSGKENETNEQKILARKSTFLEGVGLPAEPVVSMVPAVIKPEYSAGSVVLHIKNDSEYSPRLFKKLPEKKEETISAPETSQQQRRQYCVIL